MLHAFVNCAMVLKKLLNFFYFQWKKVDQVRSELDTLLPNETNLCSNCLLLEGYLGCEPNLSEPASLDTYWVRSWNMAC
jgi:hypothetical protein